MVVTPDALYIIEHHIAHHDFDLLEKSRQMRLKLVMKFPKQKNLKMMMANQFSALTLSVKQNLKAEIIDAQQKEILPLLEKHKGIYDGWGTYFEDPNADDDEYGDDGEFFEDEDNLGI